MNNVFENDIGKTKKCFRVIPSTMFFGKASVAVYTIIITISFTVYSVYKTNNDDDDNVIIIRPRAITNKGRTIHVFTIWIIFIYTRRALLRDSVSIPCNIIPTRFFPSVCLTTYAFIIVPTFSVRTESRTGRDEPYMI